MTLIALAACVVGGAFPGTRARAQQFSAPPGALVPFTEYTLDNGLKVILAPNKNATATAVCVTYDAGARYDPPGRAGLAHLCEHMMFKGSANVAAGEHADLVQGVGGEYNATTTKECTRYFETVPPNQLPLALYLEADRMRGLAITDNHVDQVRAEVLAEKGLNYDDMPYDAAEAACERLAYSEYGYEHPAFGTDQDIDAITTADVRSFMDRYYAPNRAAICVTGQFDPVTTQQLIARDFNAIPRGHDCPDPTEGETGITAYRTATVRDRFAAFNSYTRGYSMPAETDRDSAAIALLAKLLTNGDFSQLYRAVVQDARGASVSSYYTRHRHRSLLTITVRYVDGVDKIKRILDKQLAAIARYGVSSTELERARATLELSELDDAADPAGLAKRLSADAVCDGDANRMNEDLVDLDRVTPADIRRVVARYLVRNHMCEVYSGLQFSDSLPDLEKPPTPSLWKRFIDFLSGNKAHSPLVDDAGVDSPKNKAPIAPTEPISMPEAREYTLPNGLRVALVENHGIPTVHIELTVGAGIVNETKPGAALATSFMLVEGSRYHPWPRFGEDLAERGIRITPEYYQDLSTFNATARSADAMFVLKYLADEVEHPDFSEVNFARSDYRLIRRHEEIDGTAHMVFYNIEYRTLAASTPYDRRLPQVRDLIALDAADALKFYAGYYKPNRSVLTVSGDFDPVGVQREIAARFGSWAPGRSIGVRPTPPVSTKHAFVVDWPHNSIASLHVCARAPSIDSPDRAAFEVLDQILARGPSSRLHHRLRERMAKVYASQSYLIDYPTWSMWRYATSGEAADFPTLYSAIRQEINRIAADPVPPDELDRAKCALIGRAAIDWNAPEDVASTAGTALMFRLPPDFADRNLREIQQVTAADVMRVARTYLAADRLCTVGIGPKTDLAPAFAPFGSVDVLDDQGNPRKKAEGH